MRDTLSAAWYARALFSRGTNPPPPPPIRAPQSEATRFSPFFSLFFFFSPPIASYAATTLSLPKYRRVPSAGVRPSSSGQSLRGGGGGGREARERCSSFERSFGEWNEPMGILMWVLCGIIF